MAVTARQEGIVTCAGGTGLMVWLVVKTLWWRVYRVLTSCHVQLLQLWLVLISCCSHWINKGNMTQSNISVAVFALKCCWRDGTSFFSVILRCFFSFFMKFSCCPLAKEHSSGERVSQVSQVSHSTSESKSLQLETFCQEMSQRLKNFGNKIIHSLAASMDQGYFFRQTHFLST